MGSTCYINALTRNHAGFEGPLPKSNGFMNLTNIDINCITIGNDLSTLQWLTSTINIEFAIFVCPTLVTWTWIALVLPIRLKVIGLKF